MAETRKPAAKKAATRKESPVSETPESPAVDVDSVEQDDNGEGRRRGGRKPSPLTEHIRTWEKAKARADRARSRAAKVQDVQTELATAEQQERDAYQALQDAMSNEAPTTDTTTSVE
ncbi:hypothetical protein C6N75_09690 [Streptomyces solincola]|uniref:Uncharacterized protein n=1 Tax=Streptomyces solincola TaxID=2100817 RepID=A0A2S9PYC7_9ACTN|nr:hypothetical protein [Streptomyces solincola]PRH79347.1 hypothetical protein C6N75_09690 [Streptomyces solincola]